MNLVGRCFSEESRVPPHRRGDLTVPSTFHGGPKMDGVRLGESNPHDGSERDLGSRPSVDVRVDDVVCPHYGYFT